MRRSEVYVNRELRWLAFNERVLQIAENPSIPLLERLKFIGIFSSNLDEFYSVRVGLLNRMLHDPEGHPAPVGVKPRHLIHDILNRVQELSKRVDSAFASILSACREERIFFVDENSISIVQSRFIAEYFKDHIRSRLFPIMLSEDQEFPYLKHLTIYLAVDMHDRTHREVTGRALIEIPSDILPRYIEIPSSNGRQCYIILDDIIRLHLDDIFSSLPYDDFSAYTIKITRDAEYDLAEEVTKSLYEKVSHSIEQRREGSPVRVVYDHRIPRPFLASILERSDLGSCDNIIEGGKYHNARDLIAFPRSNRRELYYPDQDPVNHPYLEGSRNLMNTIFEEDALLHLPYQRFDYVIDLLREAALDPDVVSIKMTLYRVAEDSNVINALRNAARNGKHVTLFIELQARFDEKHNMYWTNKLSREANIRLIKGVEGYKIHSKILVITKRFGKSKRRIALIGTGNFNEKTARLYTDHILLTADLGITNETNKIFKILSNNFYEAKFRSLIVSPFNTRKRIIKMIKKEIENHRNGMEASITLKINNLVDEKLIRQLVAAIYEGVTVILLVRGIFSLTVDQKKVTGTYIAKAMIDRYLEHTRIYRFHNSGSPRYFIGSADIMERNLDNRIEVLVPINSESLQQELQYYLDQHIADTRSSFSLHAENFNGPLALSDDRKPGAQHELYHHFKALAGEPDP